MTSWHSIATLEMSILIYGQTLNDLEFGRGEVGCTLVGSWVFICEALKLESVSKICRRFLNNIYVKM